jgi:hypothetical protein
MAAESVYFGIECRSCCERIPLVEVISGPHISGWGVPDVKPFRVLCTGCGREFEYKYRHLILFTGPEPGPHFTAHQQFKDV